MHAIYGSKNKGPLSAGDAISTTNPHQGCIHSTSELSVLCTTVSRRRGSIDICSSMPSPQDHFMLARDTTRLPMRDQMDRPSGVSRSLSGVRRLRSDGKPPQFSTAVRTLSFSLRHHCIRGAYYLICNHGYNILTQSLRRILDRSSFPAFLFLPFLCRHRRSSTLQPSNLLRSAWPQTTKIEQIRAPSCWSASTNHKCCWQ